MNFTGKIKCVKCGKQFGVRRDIYENRIKLAGSEEILLKTYICRNCKKPQLYPQQNLPPINEKNDLPKKTTSDIKIQYVPPKPSFHILNNKENIEAATKNSCFRPDIYLDNDKTCDLCHLNEFCIAPTKGFKKIHHKSKNNS